MPAFNVPANLAFDTLSSLKGAITQWIDRTDIVDSLPAMIALAEARMKRELEPVFTETSADIVFAAGAGALPSDCGMPVTLRYDGRRNLPQISIGSALDHSGYSEPQCFTLERGGIYVWPPVDCTATLVYRQGFVPLSEAAPSNWILQQFPDAYFFGTLVYAEGWTANDSRASVMASMFDSALASIKAYLTQKSLSGPLVPRLSCP